MHVEAIAATPQGKVRGRLSDGVYVFKGIPYAAAPFGAHRFALWDGRSLAQFGRSR